MKHTKYFGLFRDAEGVEHNISCNAMSAFQAMFILIGRSIELGKHCNLVLITDPEHNRNWSVGDISKLVDMLTPTDA